jgi:hypothetical protein
VIRFRTVPSSVKNWLQGRRSVLRTLLERTRLDSSGAVEGPLEAARQATPAVASPHRSDVLRQALGWYARHRSQLRLAGCDMACHVVQRSGWWRPPASFILMKCHFFSPRKQPIPKDCSENKGRIWPGVHQISPRFHGFRVPQGGMTTSDKKVAFHARGKLLWHGKLLPAPTGCQRRPSGASVADLIFPQWRHGHPFAAVGASSPRSGRGIDLTPHAHLLGSRPLRSQARQ